MFIERSSDVIRMSQDETTNNTKVVPPGKLAYNVKGDSFFFFNLANGEQSTYDYTEIKNFSNVAEASALDTIARLDTIIKL